MASKEQAAEEVGSSQTAPLSNSERLRKRDQIARACETADVDALINLADSTGGLLEDVLRQSACTPHLYASATVRTADPFQGQSF